MMNSITACGVVYDDKIMYFITLDFPWFFGEKKFEKYWLMLYTL